MFKLLLHPLLQCYTVINITDKYYPILIRMGYLVEGSGHEHHMELLKRTYLQKLYANRSNKIHMPV